MSRGRIIILNGVGSVGKTSVGRALQSITTEPFLLVQMDAFLDMLPSSMVGDPAGIRFEITQEAGAPSIAIGTGPVADRAMRGMRHAVAAMARQGNNLIVDEVLLGAPKQQEYRELLAGFEVSLVGLFASLDVLEARERARADRLIGLARWQFDRVHRALTYDLQLDTSLTSPLGCAEMIKAALRI